MAKGTPAGDRKLIWLDQVASDPEITDFALRVAVAIAAHTSMGGTSACISNTALATWCRATVPGVRKARDALLRRWHIRLTPGSKRRASVYHLEQRPLTSDGAAPVAPTGRLSAAHRERARIAKREAEEDREVLARMNSGRARISPVQRDALREAQRREQKERGARSGPDE
jgi:hypothetical protein